MSSSLLPARVDPARARWRRIWLPLLTNLCSSTPIPKARWRCGTSCNDAELPLKAPQRGVGDIVKAAKRDGTEWVFIDTAPNMSASVTDAIRAATLVVVPCRPGVFDLEAVKETVAFARELRKPYAVVINGAPARRDGIESPMVTQARESLLRLRIPVWGGQITQRANFSLALAEGEGAKEFNPESFAAAEIGRLWMAIEKSVRAIHGAREAAAMHKVAA